MKPAFVVGSVCALLLVGCIDFGHAVAPYEPPGTAADAALADAVTSASSDATPPLDTGPSCVEGEVPATDLGPQIRFQSFSVDRPTIEIARGDVVTWTNGDSMDHTATAGAPGLEIPPSSGGFASPLMVAGDRWAFRFCAARELVWFCRTHPVQMRDYRIVVR